MRYNRRAGKRLTHAPRAADHAQDNDVGHRLQFPAVQQTPAVDHHGPVVRTAQILGLSAANSLQATVTTNTSACRAHAAALAA